MAADIAAGLKVVSEMLGPDIAERMEAAQGSEAFGMKRGDFALRWVFSELWTREGLARRDRSLVTLGILIALRQTEEIKIYVMAAIRNGVSVKEIEEVLYHACAYAGFPAATHATHIATEVLKENGLID